MADIEFRVATEFNVVKVRVSEEASKRIQVLQAACRCLGCERARIDDERFRRGLCDTCYGGVRNAIAKHRTTERDLMREGKLLAPLPGGRKPKNAFTAAVNGRTDTARAKE